MIAWLLGGLGLAAGSLALPVQWRWVGIAISLAWIVIGAILRGGWNEYRKVEEEAQEQARLLRRNGHLNALHPLLREGWNLYRDLAVEVGAGEDSLSAARVVRDGFNDWRERTRRALRDHFQDADAEAFRHCAKIPEELSAATYTQHMHDHIEYLNGFITARSLLLAGRVTSLPRRRG